MTQASQSFHNIGIWQPDYLSDGDEFNALVNQRGHSQRGQWLSADNNINVLHCGKERIRGTTR